MTPAVMAAAPGRPVRHDFGSNSTLTNASSHNLLFTRCPIAYTHGWGAEQRARRNMAPKKSKKAKPGNELEPEVAVRMHDALQAGQLDPADLATVFRVDAPGCAPADKPGAACKGRKDNPNCLCGLAPAPGSFRRKGLWQKDPEVVAKLGIDPADSRRQQVCNSTACTAAPSLGLPNLCVRSDAQGRNRA